MFMAKDVIANNISYHDRVAEEYNAVMVAHHPNEWIRQRVKEKFCGLVPSGRVLDFGGGTGLDLGWLTEAGYEVVFCEPSAGMRQRAMVYEKEVLKSGRVAFLEGALTDFATWTDQLKVDAILSD